MPLAGDGFGRLLVNRLAVQTPRRQAAGKRAMVLSSVDFPQPFAPPAPSFSAEGSQGDIINDDFF
jgi:hypothetical protein